MCQRVAVGGILHCEIVAFDDACKSLADCRTDDVNLLPLSEKVDFEFHARRKLALFRLLVRVKSKLGHQVAGLYLGCGKVAGCGF